MKIYKYNKYNTKWYQKIDFVQLLIVIALVFSFFFFFLNFIGKDFERAISTSLFITFLIFLYIIIKSFIENRDTVYLQDGNQIKYVALQKGRDGSLITYLEYLKIVNDNKLKDIVSHNEKYEGIITGEVINIYKVKKMMNRSIVIANVKEKKWKISGVFKIKKVEIIERECKKKFVITNDYDEYDVLIQTIKNYNDNKEINNKKIDKIITNVKIEVNYFGGENEKR